MKKKTKLRAKKLSQGSPFQPKPDEENRLSLNAAHPGFIAKESIVNSYEKK